MSESPKRIDTPKPTGAARSATRSGSGPYCPDTGDLIWIDLDPTKGHEQRGRRPAIVLSPRAYNERAGLCVACPITNRSKGYPFEVALAADVGVTGVVLADHVRSISWSERQAEFIAAAPASVLTEAREKLAALLGVE